MGKCCICGKEASFLRLGMWWCEEHREYVNKKVEEKSKDISVSNPGGSLGSAPSIDFGLKWL